MFKIFPPSCRPSERKQRESEVRFRSDHVFVFSSQEEGKTKIYVPDFTSMKDEEREMQVNSQHQEDGHEKYKDLQQTFITVTKKCPQSVEITNTILNLKLNIEISFVNQK